MPWPSLTWMKRLGRCRSGDQPSGGRAIAIGADVTDADAVDRLSHGHQMELGFSADPRRQCRSNACQNLLFKMSEDDWEQSSRAPEGRIPHDSVGTAIPYDQRSMGSHHQPTSVAALGNRGQANYSAAKGRPARFHQALALELGNMAETRETVRLKAPPIGSVAKHGSFLYGCKDKARRIPQEKGIPRRIELKMLLCCRDYSSLPTITDLSGLRCLQEPTSAYGHKGGLGFTRAYNT